MLFQWKTPLVSRGQASPMLQWKTTLAVQNKRHGTSLVCPTSRHPLDVNSHKRTHVFCLSRAHLHSINKTSAKCGASDHRKFCLEKCLIWGSILLRFTKTKNKAITIKMQTVPCQDLPPEANSHKNCLRYGRGCQA